MPIISSGDSDYNELLVAIRNRVNNAYDTNDLPDIVIAGRAYLGEANAKVAALVPNYAALSVDLLSRLKDAVVYQAAIELLLSESRLVSEDVEASEVARYQSLDIEKTIMRYEDNINLIVSQVLSVGSVTLTGFAGIFCVTNPTKRF